MTISIASGKGGTGKTTVATNLVVSLQSDVQILDCDVEEPNCHLFLQPDIEIRKTITVPIPEINMEKCDLCGKCVEICQFKALMIIGKSVLTFADMCHSCGGCVEVCPQDAVLEKGRDIGLIELGSRKKLDFVHGRLRIGEAMAPPLIKKVRSKALNNKISIIDAPPGTSCPVISAIKGSDFVLLVTEPTPFGLHDLILAVEAVKILDIPKGLVINRSDIGDSKVKNYAEKENIPVLMEIPFDKKIAQTYSKGKLIVEEMPEWKEKFKRLYKRINELSERREIINR